MQIIAVLETKNRDGSDYLYFKSIINRFYVERGTGIPINPVFLNGKGNYLRQEKQIREKIKGYAENSKVIYFFDVDSPDIKSDQQQLNNDIINHCKSTNREVVWFKRTIEEVMLGQVITKNKNKEAYSFLKRNLIDRVDAKKLYISEFDLLTDGKSNVLFVLDKYLIKK